MDSLIGRAFGWLFVIAFLGAVVFGDRLGGSTTTGDAPDDARVFVSRGWMVPLPYAETMLTPGIEMSLGEAREIGVDPIENDVIDWGYTTRVPGWLGGEAKSEWAMRPFPNEPPPDPRY